MQFEHKICAHEGCNRQACPTGQIRKRDGLKTRQKYCDHHKKVRYNFAGFGYIKNKKTYCENIDGRLGYKCTTTIVDPCQLDVDHINGDHSNNDPENCQTFCKCCHSYKTFVNKDNLNRYAA